MTSKLHPNQVPVSEGWIDFHLNDSPIHTDTDGAFNCLCIMDARSCYHLATELVSASKAEP